MVIPINLTRLPTGIPTFDSIIKGGFPSGSLVLLTGDAGAGNIEFAYTSAAMLSMLKGNPDKYRQVKEQLGVLMTTKDEELKLPEKICYISFIRSKEDILKELNHSFSPELATALSENMIFEDLSQSSVFPGNDNGWMSMNSLRSVDEERELLKKLTTILDTNAPNNLVIIDSLTSLFRACSRFITWSDSVSFLEDLQRKSKKWDGLVYMMLGRGIFESLKEEEMMDVADGVLVFEWFQEGFSRQQGMYLKKFRGVMPHIARDYIVRFDTMVTNNEGFVVTNVKRIFGRK
ncbi:MAG TPA: ATPase domain-containing protein [candidate division Zixibacteria bacterium]|nr:ATPase domain-containing protein [candidate division Zixibacteria bacterium]